MLWLYLDCCRSTTKSVHFILVKDKYTLEKLTHLPINCIVRLHGVPVSIICDQGLLFISHFWRVLQRGLGTQWNMSMTFQPKSDGLRGSLGVRGYASSSVIDFCG